MCAVRADSEDKLKEQFIVGFVVPGRLVVVILEPYS